LEEDFFIVWDTRHRRFPERGELVTEKYYIEKRSSAGSSLATSDLPRISFSLAMITTVYFQSIFLICTRMWVHVRAG